MTEKKLQPFAIYIFSDKREIYAASLVDKDGIREVYGQGFKLTKDKKSKLNSPAQIKRRAKRSVVNALSNTLNAINLYGKNVLNEDGNVNWELFQLEEYKAAQMAEKFSTTLDKTNIIHTFKTYEISMETAKKYNLI